MINVIITEKMHIQNVFIFMYEVKKRMAKDVFRHLKSKLFNSYMDHRLHLFVLLIEFYKSSLGYAVIVDIFFPIVVDAIFHIVKI